ncbi:alpha/beta fold hydrolase [Fodinicola acaciae]|uniref:alpha/beta fold hydrolase n=1 Tax=Fodinicola acaciae TaxID=2681555 RepID=UPI0013D895BB|nr:alpha/beta hydrolase [Fodinicola acaciae]
MAHIRIPVADTALDINDSGDGQPVLFLNGMLAPQTDWKRTLRELGGRYRTITFDARGRGKSGPSKDYSFVGALDDVSAVVATTGIRRPILVGWSYGATLAVRHAARRPGEIAGLVLVDGGMPFPAFGNEEQARIRKLFGRMAPIMWILRLIGRTSVPARQAAEINIENCDILDRIAPDFGSIDCPITFVLGTKRHTGSTDEEVRKMRASVAPLAEKHDHVSVFATLPSSHTEIPFKNADTLAAAIDELARKESARATS